MLFFLSRCVSLSSALNDDFIFNQRCKDKRKTAFNPSFMMEKTPHKANSLT